MTRLPRLALIASALFSACASTPTPSASPAFESEHTAETVCDGTPKNCLPMPEEVMTECLNEMSKREGSACFDKLAALKGCFVRTAECDESGALIENDAEDRACAFENGELEACCAANAGDASCH